MTTEIAIPEAAPLATTLRPLHDYVLLRPMPGGDKTAGGLFIPEVARERRKEAVVLAIGPGAWNPTLGTLNPMPVAVGQRVLIGKWSGTDIKIDGRGLLLVRAEDILAVVEDQSANGATA